ncbi:hypothetical protein C469_00705 [Halorubrum lipolyticum DSM 21995]|uniref:Uncharacterized protein n=1 Tax=Halorubrum lipolyticum DSM 21995 TaxID=1227482 RepID=M0P3R2_9EURY|nr:hypothetical protein C469_00705 [Halorubrum lipolyticum DSM 21995]
MLANDRMYFAGIGVSGVVVVDEHELLVRVVLTVSDGKREAVSAEFVGPIGGGVEIAPYFRILGRHELVGPVWVLVRCAGDLPPVLGGFPRQPLRDIFQVMGEYALLDFGFRVEFDV